MNTNEIFIESCKLPDPLSKEELNKLFNKIQYGSKESINKVLIHNIRLVLYEVSSKFQSADYDKKDLVSIGIFGLFKAIKTYDLSRNVEFSTYAVKCIDNEIKLFFKKNKKYRNTYSLDNICSLDEEKKDLKLEYMISYENDMDILESLEQEELYKAIRKIVMDLQGRDKIIMILYFGFNNNKSYNQNEISKMLKISQSQVSKLISRIVTKIAIILKVNGFIELNVNKVKKLEKKDSVYH